MLFLQEADFSHILEPVVVASCVHFWVFYSIDLYVWCCASIMELVLIWSHSKTKNKALECMQNKYNLYAVG